MCSKVTALETDFGATFLEEFVHTMCVDITNNDEITQPLPMNPAAFVYAVQRLRMASAPRDSARMVLVDKVSRAEAMAATGVAPHTLSKALSRIDVHLHERMKAENMVRIELIVHESTVEGHANDEKFVLGLLSKNKKKRPRKTK